MRTTIGDIAGRRGDACAEASVEETLAKARKLFADVAAFLELEMDRLWGTEIEREEEDRLRAMRALIVENQKAMRTVLEIEAKLGCETARREAHKLDLEAARAEIERRLARLAA